MVIRIGLVQEFKHAFSQFVAAACHPDDFNSFLGQQHLGHALAHGTQSPDDDLYIVLSHISYPPQNYFVFRQQNQNA
ncbi:hypothetical protein SDC9_186305 [bioreactor metagenome]|uniref:Uncharacterized protein n=1 Tax=bioreactor metagenome TaxID=1076179 RepID=A0A645HJ62_9ZZZZ